MRFSRQFWKRSGQRKSAFGGHVKPHHEVKALNQKIRDHEAQEFADFEKEFDRTAEDLWKEG